MADTSTSVVALRSDEEPAEETSPDYGYFAVRRLREIFELLRERLPEGDEFREALEARLEIVLEEVQVRGVVALTEATIRALRDVRLPDEQVRAMSHVAAGGGGGSRLRNTAGQVISPATSDRQDEIIALLGGPEPLRETRLDYDGRTDGSPVYEGRAEQGTATSATSRQVRRFDYDVDGRTVRIQILTGAWDNRAALGWT